MTATPKPITVGPLRAAARSIAAQDLLDSLIDAKTHEAARLVMDTDEVTVRALLLSAVTGHNRTRRLPPALPDDPDARDHEITERTRHLVAEILLDHPEAIGAVTLALGDAVTILGNQKRAAA